MIVRACGWSSVVRSQGSYVLFPLTVSVTQSQALSLCLCSGAGNEAKFSLVPLVLF